MLEKNSFFSFLGASYFAPKSAHRRENEPVLGPDNISLKWANKYM